MVIGFLVFWGFVFRVSRGLHVQAQHSNGFLLSWCSKGGGKPQAEFEDEACASHRVAEALCYTELGAAGRDDHHCPVPFLVLHRVIGAACLWVMSITSLCPFFLVLHRVIGAAGLSGEIPEQTLIPLSPNPEGEDFR